MTSDGETYAHNPPGRHRSPGPVAFDQQRFGKLVAMLASPADSERASAAKLATEMLRQVGLTWSDVLGAMTLPGQLRQAASPNFGPGEAGGRAGYASGSRHSRPGNAASPHQYWRDGGHGSATRRSNSADPSTRTRQSNPGLRNRFGLRAIDVVYAIFSTSADLTLWEQDFIDKLIMRANTTRPVDFAISEKQWDSLIRIASKLDLIEQVTSSPTSFRLNINTSNGDDEWARR